MPPSAMLGPCCCNANDADSQRIIGLLQRVGLAKFIFSDQAMLLPLPTGPLSQIALGPGGIGLASGNTTPTNIDPLYLVYTGKLVWDDSDDEFEAGTTYTCTTTYDPKFSDMTVVTTGSTPTQNSGPSAGPPWSPSTQTNIPASFNDGGVGPVQPQPVNSPQRYYDGGNPNSINLSIATDGLSWSWSTDSYVDDSGIDHVGCTFTATLSKPFTMDQFAAIADEICLNAATLQDGTLNPTKTYPCITSSASTNTTPIYLRYFCEFKNTPGYTPGISPPVTTNTLIVYQVRGKDGVSPQYIYGTNTPYGMFEFGSWAFFTGLASNGLTIIGQVPCAGGGWGTNQVPGVDLSNWGNGNDAPLTRYPLAAHGMTFNLSYFGRPAGPGYPGGIPGAGFPGAPSYAAAWIFSVTASIRARVDISPTATALLYNPATDSYNQMPVKLPPTIGSGAGEHIFTPGAVGGVGALLAIYSAEQYCAVQTAPLPNWQVASGPPSLPQGSNPIPIAAGQSLTFYACTFDKNGQWCQTRAAAWSLVSASGAITQANLVPSPDGQSAIFTAPATGGGQAFVVIAIAGLTFESGAFLEII